MKFVNYAPRKFEVCDYTTLEDLIEARQAEYTEKEGKRYSYQEAKDEVTCNAIEAIQTAENFAEEFTQTMAELQYPKAEAEGKLTALQKFFRKIKLALNNILSRIKNKRGGDLMITAEGKTISKDAAMVNDLLKKVRQGLVNVRTNYDSYVAGAEVKGVEDGKVRKMYRSSDVITADMSEDTRAEILKNKSITVPYYMGQIDAEIKTDEENINGIVSEAKKAFKRLNENLNIIRNGEHKYFNFDLDISFGFSGGSLDESVSKHKRDPFTKEIDRTVLAKLMPVLEQAADGAVCVEVHDNRYYDDNSTKAFYALLGGYIEGNNFIPIRFGVKEFNNEQYELYIVVGSNKIKTEVLEMTVWDKTSDPNNSHPVSIISIPRIIENVNPQDISLLKYLPSPLLNSEQVIGKKKGIEETKRYTDNKNNNAYQKHVYSKRINMAEMMLSRKAKQVGYVSNDIGELHKGESIKVKDVTYDDTGTLIPISERYDETNSDERYQHISSEAEEQAKADELTALREENKALKAMDKRRWQMIDYLQKQLDQWKRGGKKLDYRGIEKLARSLIKEYGANVDVKSYAKELTGIFNYVANNKNPSPDVIRNKYTELAEKLVYNVVAVNPEVQERLNNIKGIIKGGVSLNVNQRGDVLHRFETMAKYRERVGSTVKITNKGIPLDDAWNELSDMYPDLFPADTTDADQPIVMAEVIASLNDNLKYNPIAEEYLGNEEAVHTTSLTRSVPENRFNMTRRRFFISIGDILKFPYLNPEHTKNRPLKFEVSKYIIDGISDS